MQAALSRRSMKSAIEKWYVRGLGAEVDKYLASIETEPRPIFHEKALETSIGNFNLWECSLETIDILSDEPLSKKLPFERFVQLEGSSRIEPFHRK
jgi:hypothetical protein